MWIIPSTLLKCAPGMVALDLASKESLVRDCAPSHIVSLRGFLKPISSVRWKKDSWMSHLFGAMLNPSHTENFTDWWTSSLQDTPASHSVMQGKEEEKTTQDTCGRGSQMEFGFSDQECASLKMSKDTYRWDSPASSATWKSWVTRCRGEYSVRVKLAHLTGEKGCLSWPTASVMDTTGGSYKTEWKGGRAVSYHNHTVKNPVAYGAKLADAVKFGPHAPENHSTNGSRQGSWATPSTMLGSMYVEHNTHKRNSPSLATQEAWSTPRANKVHPNITEENREQLATRNKSNLEEEIAGHCGTATGKLNPRWVETLMGLPIGWTMPSCACPVIPAPMSYAFSETESCQAHQNEHLES